MPVSEIILIVSGLLTLAMLAGGLSRSLTIPYSVFLVILGVVLGELARYFQAFEPLLEFRLTPELVLFLFLPALVFESAFNLDARQLLKNLALVLALAIPALLVSAVIIAIGLHLILDMDLMLALLFGALISATDPVAVIALFRELGAPQRLTILIEGESLLNDATAIVLFNIVLGILVSGVVTAADIGAAAGDFIRVFLGGALCGALIGLVLSELLYRLRMGTSAYLVLTMVQAWAGFAIAEHLLHVSGVMSVVAGAITLGALGVTRIPHTPTHVVGETWEMIALVCNSLLFLLVGVTVDPMQIVDRHYAIIIAVVLVLVARAATVYTMVPLAMKGFHLPAVRRSEQHIMWWGGLKGGLAIAIVLSITDTISGKDVLLDLTVGVVMFSLLINAPSIRPLMHHLGMDRLNDDERLELQHALISAGRAAEQSLEKFCDSGIISRRTGEVIAGHNRRIFTSDDRQEDVDKAFRHVYLSALRRESERLTQLYDIGLVPYYSYLDIRNNIQLDREYRLAEAAAQAPPSGKGAASLFSRIETTMLRRLREKDWAAGLLARYQYLRFAQSLQRDLAGTLIATGVILNLEQDQTIDAAQKQRVIEIFHERLQRRRQRLDDVARQFPDFFARFTNRLLSRVSLNVAASWIDDALQHGEIGAKIHALLARKLNQATAAIPPIGPAAPVLRPGDLVKRVPLLKDLPESILQPLIAHARPITFLTNDVIIGEGEHGDALYLISHGHVLVGHRDQPDKVIAELRDGEFFGEMALLGDQVRTATVRAASPTTVLRLSRRDVLGLAEREPELKSRLEAAEHARRGAST